MTIEESTLSVKHRAMRSISDYRGRLAAKPLEPRFAAAWAAQQVEELGEGESPFQFGHPQVIEIVSNVRKLLTAKVDALGTAIIKGWAKDRPEAVEMRDVCAALIPFVPFGSCEKCTPAQWIGLVYDALSMDPQAPANILNAESDLIIRMLTVRMQKNIDTLVTMHNAL